MDISNNIAKVVSHSDVEEFDELDTRVSAIECLYTNIIGVNESTIEWCPNDEPPLKEEYLAWLWVTQPSMGNKILPECSEELTKLINAYNSNKMEDWFEYIST